MSLSLWYQLIVELFLCQSHQIHSNTLLAFNSDLDRLGRLGGIRPSSHFIRAQL